MFLSTHIKLMHQKVEKDEQYCKSAGKVAAHGSAYSSLLGGKKCFLIKQPQGIMVDKPREVEVPHLLQTCPIFASFPLFYQ